MLVKGATGICITGPLWREPPVTDGRASTNHQPHDCLFTCLFQRISKETSKLRVTGLCAGNSPGTGEFPAQMTSNAENVSIWWGHHVFPFDNIIMNLNQTKVAQCWITDADWQVHVLLKLYFLWVGGNPVNPLILVDPIFMIIKLVQHWLR